MVKIAISVIAILMLVAAPGAFAQTWEGATDEDGNRHGTWTKSQDDYSIPMEIITYRHGTQHGPSSYFHPSGRDYIKTNFKDGILDGSHASFYDNEENSKWEAGSHANGVRFGEWVEWHPNGEKKSTRNFFNDKLHGAASYSYTSGGKQSTTEYRNNDLHGPYVSYFDNGDNSKQFEGQHTNNLRSGEWTEWHSNGKEKSFMNYVAGKLHGPAEQFHASGQKYRKTNYKLDELHGPFTEYYDNGDNSKRWEGTHRNNLRFGKWEEWHENGTKISEVIYRNGKMNGPASYFSSYDGGLRMTTVYEDDQHHGPYVKYHFDATTKEEYGEHRNGKREGEWIIRYDDGELKAVSNWQDGKRQGSEITYWSSGYGDGLIRAKRSYKDDELHGLEEAFYSNSDNTIRRRGSWADGKMFGLWTQWHKNGQIEWQGTHEADFGLQDGVWKEFNEDGELIKVTKFDAGKVVSEQGNCNHSDIECAID